ncbi:MAG: hypothetical protein GY716_25830 [bacterium]|nr:hypothetical protein [bacterium]
MKTMILLLATTLASLGTSAPTVSIESPAAAPASATSTALFDELEECGGDPLGDMTVNTSELTPPGNIAICREACSPHTTERGYLRCYHDCLQDLADM